MAADAINKILREASALSVEDFLRLAHELLVRAKQSDKSPRPRWRDIRGKAKASQADAQARVSVQRHESDSSRSLHSSANGSG